MQYQLADSQHTPPTSFSYWVIPDRLLAGAYPGHPDPTNHKARIHSLMDARIRRFINLMDENETNYAGKEFASYLDVATECAPDSVQMTRHAIRDNDIPTLETMTAILDAIDDALKADEPTYVHCWGGVGRTGTVIGCWLLRQRLATSRDVLEVLRKLRRKDQERGHRLSPETQTQRRFVTDWPAGPVGV